MNPTVKSFLVTFLPAPITDALRFLRRTLKRVRSPEKVFSEIYRNNLWGGAKGEMYSGPGSRFATADLYAELITKFIEDNEISSVVDIGCGDFEVGKKIAPVCRAYVGIDVVPDLITRNRQLFENDRVKFICVDVTKAKLPAADLCLVRQVFQHMSNKQILRVLKELHKYRHLIVTEHQPDIPTSYNKDKVHDAGIRFDLGSGVYLEKPPFNVREAQLIFEARPFATSERGEPVERHDWGSLRTFLIRI